MSVDRKVREIYNDTIHDVTRNQGKWKSMLELAGRIYRYEFDNILMVYAQKPRSTLVADFDTWRKVGRYVRRGSKGIAIYPSRALEPNCRYVFDISDTDGRNSNLTWELTDSMIIRYGVYLDNVGSIELPDNADIETIKNLIWDFTKQEIHYILTTDHAKRGLNTAESLKQMIESRYGTQSDQIGHELIERSIRYIVANRCGFTLSEEEQDFSKIMAINKEDVIYEFGSLICDVACDTLILVSRDLGRIERRGIGLNEKGRSDIPVVEKGQIQGEITDKVNDEISKEDIKERSDVNERGDSIQNGRGRDVISEHSNGNRESVGVGQVRADGDGIPERESQPEIQVTGEIRQADRSTVSGEHGGASDDRGHDEPIHEEPQAGESGIHNGDVEDQRAGNADSGGIRDKESGEYISLNESDIAEETIDQEILDELNKELEELNSFGESGETEYNQLSLFSIPDTVLSQDEKKKYQTEKKVSEKKLESAVPESCIKEVLLHGTGFQNGKQRVYNMMKSVMDKKERIARLKKEYGQGGATIRLESEGYGASWYDTFTSSKGIRIQWRDESGKHEGYISWNTAEQILSALVMTGEYYQPSIDEQGISDKEVSTQLSDETYSVDTNTVDESGISNDVVSDNNISADSLTPESNTLQDSNNISDDNEIQVDNEQIKTEKPINVQPADSVIEENTIQVQNYHLSTWGSKEGGAKTRYARNIDAIRLLKKIESEGRYATPDEQEILAQYVGWGGIPQVFDAGNDSWSKEYDELKAELTEKEYEAARSSVNNAFYTPSSVASAVAGSITQFGFTKGTILEPSMGIGNFFGCLPESLSHIRLCGVEIDSISGRIAKLLYPRANIEIKGYENATYSNNFFDLVIGNVPFGDYKVFDPKYNKLNFKIHDYFVAKALDQTRPGGLVILITTKGTLDKKNPMVRKYIAERAELLGAVRLPIQTFQRYAGTEVTSDILFLQKRERTIAVEPDWVHLGLTPDGIPINSYFVEHPEMMLGQMEYDKGKFGDNSNYTVCVNHDENFNVYEAVSGAISKIHGEIINYDLISEEEETMSVDIPADPNVKNFTFVNLNGEIYYRKDSRMYLWEANDKVIERIKGLLRIRTVTRYLILIQMEGCTEDVLKDIQKELNEEYDSFVAKYGPITNRMNASAFRDDADYPLLCSLEVVDEDGNISKSDIFTKQTIRRNEIPDHVETAVEALNLSVNELNEVNIPYMLSVYEPNIEGYRKDIAQSTGEKAEDVSFSLDAENELKREKLIEELHGVIFCDPELYNEDDRNKGWVTADEYLSGNVRYKLSVAKIHAKEHADIFGINVEALEKVQPKDLDAGEIDVDIGATWIEPADYQEFIYELLNTRQWARDEPGKFYRSPGIIVNLNRKSMEWFIANKSLDKHSQAATKTYGTNRMDAYTIFENTLNMRIVTIRDRIDDGGGKYHYELNQKETMLAREKQNQIKVAFREWIWKDPDRRQKYVDYYNETFNSVRLREYDGSHLTFPGMNPDIELQEHQRSAVARMLKGGNALLAHCVGAGKTFELVAACMEMKRLGIVNKTVMVVPKPLVGQMASEFLRLYPSANILVTGEKDFSKKRRQQFISRIATGDYDCIIMSHQQFEKIPISMEREKALLERQAEELTEAIAEMIANDETRSNWTVKQMETAKKNILEQIQTLNSTPRDDVITFEELGIDCLMVDEAHCYKNLAIFSKMTNVAGITSGGSKRAMDMYLKCQYITEINGGRGVIFATGTPISNSLCEMYVMQTFLQKDTLEQLGIFHFDSWAANFGEVTTALELNVEGNGFRFRNRFNRFKNLPELMNIFKECADIRMRDSLELDVPALKGGNYVISATEPDWYTKTVMEEFVRRAEAIHNGNVDPSVDNFLKITNDARLLGTDARLLEPTAPANPDGKLNQAADNIYREYKEAEEKGIIGTQLVFCDIGTPKKNWSEDMLEDGYYDRGNPFDVYNYIKSELVRKGIPADEIAFVHDAKTDAQRETLFRQMRQGVKKIMIGSTEKCGTGVNVQTHLIAMHHLDCPWKPSSIEQREGRGIRQGNENEEVAVYRYVTKGTFDAYLWSIVENKQRFISQVMTSKAVSRSCEDIDEVTFQYAEIKAVATGNPLIKEKMQIDNDVQRLKLLKNNYDSQHYQYQDSFMVKYPKLIKAAEEKMECVKEDVKLRDEMKEKETEFAIVIGNTRYDEREPAGRALLAVTARSVTGVRTEVGEYRGFKLYVEKVFMGEPSLILSGKTEYKIEMSTSPVGMMVRLENKFDSIHETIEFLEQRLDSYHRDMEQAKIDFEKPFSYEQELNDKLKRQIEIDTELNLSEGNDGGKKAAYNEDEPDRNESKVAEDRDDYGTNRNNR